MDIDQHTRLVTEALLQRLREDWKPRLFSDRAQRVLAADSLVTEIRAATQELVASELAAQRQAMATPPRKDPLTEAIETNARLLAARRPTWSEAAREPAPTPAPEGRNTP